MKILTRLIPLLTILLAFGGNAYGQCTSAGQGLYLTTAVNTTCNPKTIATDAYTDEYSVITGATANTYSFSSSVATDYITITDAANVPLAFGVTPVSITFAAAPGNLRFYRHDNSSCPASSLTNRTVRVACTSCAPPATLPTCPTPSAPAANATGVSLTPTLSWATATNASSYDIYLNVDATCSVTPTTLIANVSTNTYVVTTPLANSTQYRWMVVPRNCAGAGPASCPANARCFTTTGTPTPVNDNCAGATSFAISPNGACTYAAVSTVGATQSAPVSGCTGSDDDVWYTFNPTLNGVYTISYNSLTAVVGTATTVGLEIFSGSCAGLTSLGCTSGYGTGGTGSILTPTLVAGTPYYLRVWAGGTANSATWNMCIENPVPPPANDDCAGATSITSGPGLFVAPPVQSTAGALQSQAPIPCGTPVATSPNALDVWYQFQTDADGGDISITVTPVGDADIVLEGFTTAGSCSGASVCADAAITAPSAETLTMTALSLHGTGSTENTATYYFRVYRYGSVVPFTFNINATGTALPLELKSFTGLLQGSTNLLTWETLTEKNVQFHVVDRSLDGVRWSEVGRVNGKGDSQVSVKYSWEDRAPLAKAYYRLRSVDFDGKESRSASIVLTRKGDHFAITSVYPSPTKSDVTVQFNATSEEKVTIRVMDMTGRLVLEQYTEAVKDINELPITLTGLESGVYSVTVSNSTGVSAPVRFVKQ